MAEERRSELIFGGDLLVFKRVPALVEAAAVGDELIPAAPGEDEIGEIQARFTQDARIERLMREALEQVGVVRTERTGTGPAADRPAALRTRRRDARLSPRYLGVQPARQANWWLPLRPLTSERTIAFYPEYWSKPLANTSASWSLSEVVERRRAGKPVASSSRSPPSRSTPARS